MPQIPTQQWCFEQEGPEKRHQWMFVASMPFGRDTYYTPDGDTLAYLSTRVQEAGYSHISELEALADAVGMVSLAKVRQQVKKLQPPPAGQAHTLNNTSQWVDMDAPDPGPIAVADMSQFTVEQNIKHVEQLRNMGVPGVIPDIQEPGPSGARVVGKEFDPAAHGPAVVIGYLLGQDDAERKRVLAAELRGGRRSKKILGHPDWVGLT